MSSGVIFIFSPALYPGSPLENKLVFAHGEIIHVKARNGEIDFRIKDEKGEWEGFIEERNAPALNAGEIVRVYGIISAQPDGRNVLACKWMKTIQEEEKQFCARKTTEEWTRVVGEHAQLNGLKPYEFPQPKIVKVEQKVVQKRESDENEFISAAEIKVEREYL